MTQYSHKSNNTPLAHTTRQSTSSSLRATWLTVSSPALTVPAIDNAPSTDAERSLTLPQIHQCRRSLPSTSVDDLRRRYCTVHRRQTFSHASSDHQCTPISRDVLCEISQRRSLTAYILSDSPDDNGRSPVIRDVALSSRYL